MLDPVVADIARRIDDQPDILFQMMSMTENKTARLVEELYRHDLRYCDTWGKWLRWDESRWQPEHTLLAFHICRLIAQKINQLGGGGHTSPEKASFARGVESFCRASRTFATTVGQWDADSWLLNTPGGTVDTESGNLRPHTKADHITKVTRVTPAEGPHPVFDRFMRDITLEDAALVEYLQRALGACLSGAIQDNFLLFWYGTGQNGKNTLGDLVAWILGDYAKAVPIETLVSNKNSAHPTMLANLRGLRMAVCSEVSEGTYWDEARVKSLTGDTEISARFMRQDFFEFKRTHKHLVYGNHRPMLRVIDPGMKARLHIVPFKAHFSPETRNPNMAEELKAEAPQILQWLIEGHLRWLEDGYLKKCSAVQQETDAYFESQSTPEMWVTECCEQVEQGATQAKDMFASFKAWKELRGEGVMSQTRWGEWMQRYPKRLMHGRMYYMGFKLKTDSMVTREF